MKRSDTHAFVNQLLVCVLVTIGFGGSIGLGTVWLRHQISLTANANRTLELRIAELERRINDASILVDEAQNLDLLLRRNREEGFALVPKTDGRMVHLPGDPVRRLAQRANRELFTPPPRGSDHRLTVFGQ